MKKEIHDLTDKELKEALSGARRILSLMDSPFPDSIEKQNRQMQSEYVMRLECEQNARFD